VPAFEGFCRTIGSKESPEAPHSSHEQCDGEEECRGVCDGMYSDECTYPDVGTECGVPKCEDGVETSYACNEDLVCTQQKPRPCSPTCDGDHTLLILDKFYQDCTPYKCDESACLTSCISFKDCVPPNVCNLDGKCVDLPGEPELSSCSAAPVGSTPERSDWFWAASLLVAGGGLRRIRRRGAA
jgi:MYXO-CTERM domain-containing protein